MTLNQKATVVAHTVPVDQSSIQEFIAYCARVSNEANQNNKATAKKLVDYLVANKHFSPLEMVNFVVEVETPRDIARQLLRHRSFTFQEFCIAGESVITFTNGDEHTISELFDLWCDDNTVDYVETTPITMYNVDTGEISSSYIREVFYTGRKKVFTVITEGGNKIRCTEDHKFLVEGEFYPLNELGIFTEIATVVDGVLLFDTINSIEPAGEVDTYDIEIESSSHNYVANGFVVHNSQRYAEVDDSKMITREARLQDTKNRQNSIDADDPALEAWWDAKQKFIIDVVSDTYSEALDRGIAKEVARTILPEGNTMSRLYINGTLRSFLHYCQLRTGNGTQKEHQELAWLIADAIDAHFPFKQMLEQ